MASVKFLLSLTPNQKRAVAVSNAPGTTAEVLWRQGTILLSCIPVQHGALLRMHACYSHGIQLCTTLLEQHQ